MRGTNKMQVIQEEWRPVVGWETCYQVSNTGRVKSLKNNKQLELSIHIDRNGYSRVSLSKKGVGKTMNVHALVAEAFLGPRPQGMWVLHGPLGVECNHVSNLSYGTPTQNAQDRERDGTVPRGSRNGRSKLTEEEVMKVIELLEKGNSVAAIAKLYGVTRRSIQLIKTEKNWTWLTKSSRATEDGIERLMAKLIAIENRLDEIAAHLSLTERTWLAPAEMAKLCGVTARTLLNYVSLGKISTSSYKRETHGQREYFRYHKELVLRDLGMR